MGIIGGWHPLSGPKVEAVASSRVGLLSSPLAGAIPRAPIPSTSDDGFLLEPCCSRCGDSGGCCGGEGESEFAVNVATGSLLYHYHVPENTIPIKVFYESDQTGVSTMGSLGWRTNYHRSIEKAVSSMVTVVCADGMKVGYTQSSDPEIFYPASGIDNFLAEDGADPDIYSEALPSGLVFRYNLQGGTTGRLENIIDPDGRLWTLTYSASGLESVKNHRGRLVTFHYSASKISAIEDSAARRTTFTYNGSNQLTSIKAPDGAFTTFAYHGATQRLNTFTDPEGELTSFSYDGSNRVQDVTADDPAGPSGDLITTFSYAASTGTVKNPLGDLTTYTYDGSSRLTRLHDPEQNVTTYAYDANSRVTTVTNPRSFTTKYLWEAVTASGDDTRRRLRGLDPATSGNLTTFGYSGTNYELDEVQVLRGPISANNITTFSLTTYAYTNRHLSSLVNPKREITTWNYTSNVLSSIDNPLNYRTTFTFGASGKVASVVDAERKITSFTYDSAANLQVVVNHLNYRTTYAYDAVNRRTSFQDQEADTTTYDYTPSGLLEVVVSPLSYRTTYVYNFSGLKTSDIVFNATRYFTTYSYDKGKNLTSIKNARGFFTTHAYDNIGRRIASQDAVAKITTYVYDRNSNLTSTKDPSGAFLTSVYDSLDRLEVSIDALNYWTTFGYDKANNRTFIRNPRGYFSTYTYDAVSRVTTVFQADGGIVTTVYDAAGNVQRQINERGGITTYVYDKTNHRTVVQDALRNLTTNTYDSVYNVTSIKNPRGAFTTYTYDKVGRVTLETRPLGQSMLSVYDAGGNKTAQQDQSNNIWTFVYDSLNRRTVEVNPLAQRTTTVYDQIGNVSAIVYPNQERVTYTYDAADRVEVLTNPGGYWTTYGYDDVNRKATIKDFNSNISTQTFDARRMLSAALTAELILNTFIYDSVGNRQVAIDGKGQWSTFGYDAVNRLAFERDPLGFYTTYTYDDAGNRTLRRDPDGNWTTYAYDSLNRLTTVSYTGSTATMGYDQVGNLTSMVDGAGLLVQTYDLRNALLSKKRGSTIITYTYDAAGNRQTLRDETGGFTTYTYDDLDRVSVIRDPMNYWTTFSYDSRGRRAQIQHHNGTTTTYAYAPQGGIAWTENNFGGTNLTRLTYTLDKSGRTTALKSGASPNFSFTTYTYDKDYRLTAEHRSDFLTTVSYAVTYAYDKAGNRTWHRDDGVFSTLTYDARNALTGMQRPGADFTTYTYDNRGNRTKKHNSPQITTYTYDVESRLTMLDNVVASELATYAYGYSGERVSWMKNTVVTTEIWDHQSLFAATEGGTRTRYIETPSAGIGDAVAFVTGVTAKVLVPNQVGTTDSTIGTGGPPPPVSGNLVLTAFGALKDEIGTLGTKLRYVGEKQCFTDFTSGAEELIYMRARHYDPVVGRFLQKDPIGSWADSATTGNPYSYAMGNPTGFLDPHGREAYPIAPFDRRLQLEMRRVRFVEWYRRNLASMGWLSLLPHCPCSMDDGNGPDSYNGFALGWLAADWEFDRDSAMRRFMGFGTASTHPGAIVCIRTKAGVGPEGSGQQCCYDRSHALINVGIAAGSPDRVSPNTAVLGHFDEDVYPWVSALALDGAGIRLGALEGAAQSFSFTLAYLAVRPPDRGWDPVNNRPCRTNRSSTDRVGAVVANAFLGFDPPVAASPAALARLIPNPPEK